MVLKYLTYNPPQTKKLGEILAKEILKTKPKKLALVIGLEGDLGGGKTTFLQGFARGLGIKEKILSPTFIILKKFKIPSFRVVSRLPRREPKGILRGSLSRGFAYLYHIDCYRIKKPKELLDLGFKEILSNPKSIVAIEWADRVSKILPKDTLRLKFQFIGKQTRKIVLE